MGPHTRGSCNRQCTVKGFLRIALGSLACNWERQCSCFRDCRGKGGGGGGGGQLGCYLIWQPFELLIHFLVAPL